MNPQFRRRRPANPHEQITPATITGPYCAPEIIEEEDDFAINDDDDLSEVIGDSRLRYRERDDAPSRGRWN